jgi:hypothetical protein
MTDGFTSELTANGQISVPPEIALAVLRGKRLRVAISWDFSNDDSD